MAGNDETESLSYFLDESGHPELFDHKRRSLVGTEGNSRFFMVGKLAVHDPQGITSRLNALRKSLVADPYFKGIPSFDPARRKTAIQFHAKDDVAEVRREVFKLLSAEGDNLRFYAVARDKTVLLAEMIAKRVQYPQFLHVPETLYDAMVRDLFGKLHRSADSMDLCFAFRGKRNRTDAFRLAVEEAERDFEVWFGFRRGASTSVRCARPCDEGGLRAVDYFLWALQRFYEPRHVKSPEGVETLVREDRYLAIIWPQVGEIHDTDLVYEGKRGVYFYRERPLTLNNRPV